MKILYLHQHFKTNSGGTRSYEFSKYLVNNKHNVTMISGNDVNVSELDGIKIKSTKTVYNNNMSFIKRIYAFIHYIVKAIIIGIRERNVDIIYATSTPLTIGIPALILSKLKRKKFVFEVRDVWPDVPIEMGIIKNKLLVKILFKFERIIYKNASHIVVLSEGMKKNLLNKGIDKSKITVITNLAMNNYFDKIPNQKRTFFKDKLLCVHPGTMGKVNGLDYILNLAQKYPDKDIVYYLIGDGNQKERLIGRVENENISNVIIKDSINKDEVRKLIKQSDVGLMIVENIKILEDNSANKFFDFLAAGLPVVINYGGWQKEILEKHKAGKGFANENYKGFYDYLFEIKNDKILLNKISENAKQIATTEYDVNILSKKLEQILINVNQ